LREKKRDRLAERQTARQGERRGGGVYFSADLNTTELKGLVNTFKRHLLCDI